jgi:hypothetical protein
MALSSPSPRKHLHTRSIRFQGYLRDDGLWDIEAELLDTRAYVYRSREQGELAPPSTVHNMLLRVTVDDHLTIRAIETSLPTIPFAECSLTADPVQKLVGARLGAGWRQAIEDAMGGVAGCTHLRELLFNLATAVFQTVPVYRHQLMRGQGAPMHFAPGGRPPPHFGKCMSWDFNGPVMQRVAPQFYGWKPPGG